MKYKAIIFDFGNVIINISFENAINYWVKKYNKKSEELLNNFKFDEVYNDFEKGLIAPAVISTMLKKCSALNLKTMTL